MKSAWTIMALALVLACSLCNGSARAAEEEGGEAPAEEAPSVAAEPAAEEVAVVAEEGEPADSYFKKAWRKLSCGAMNIARAGTEFYVQPMEAKRVSGSDYAALWPGIGEAFGMFLTRIMGGMIDVVTSPVPFPNDEWKPLLDE